MLHAHNPQTTLNARKINQPTTLLVTREANEKIPTTTPPTPQTILPTKLHQHTFIPPSKPHQLSPTEPATNKFHPTINIPNLEASSSTQHPPPPQATQLYLDDDSLMVAFKCGREDLFKEGDEWKVVVGANRDQKNCLMQPFDTLDLCKHVSLVFHALFVCLLVCFFVCLFSCLFVCLFSLFFSFACSVVCLFVCLFSCLFVCLLAQLFV